MYEPLGDPAPAVRSTCLSVLTHLVLGGRVKAKGSVAKVARLMVDADAGAACCVVNTLCPVIVVFSVFACPCQRACVLA